MTARSMFRVLRWAGLAAIAPVLWACNARSLEAPVLKPEQTYAKRFQQSINRNVDMLFLVDDSSSMRLSQDNLRRNFPRFMTRLMDPPGLPNIHVAVVSSDMGADDGIADCDLAGSRQGIFQYSGNIIPPATTPCTTGLDPNAHFISDIAGVRNYQGNLEDVFTCMAALGESGCGFEHQFAAILRALGADGSPPPGENADFLRPDAYLVVILITNEDDCSAAPGVPLFDTSVNTNLASQLGPPANFRCNEFGHICTDQAGNRVHPNRNAPGNDPMATVPYTDCTSDEQGGFLRSVTDTATRIKRLKADPSQVLVAAITGPISPYTVTWRNPTSGTDTSCGAASCPWPVIGHSCTAADTSFADPSIRVHELVEQFGANGLAMSICDADFGPSLDQIAALINATLQPPCIPGQIAMKPGTTEPDCTVISHTANGSGGFNDSTVPSCASNGGQRPCWQFTTGMNCTGQIVDPMQLMDPNVSMSTAQNATVNCALCVTGQPDPTRGCP